MKDAESDGPGQALRDVLYGLPPAEFVSARDEAVRVARQHGDPATARELAGLRRPTTSAWLVNLLYRHQRESVEELLELGEQLAEASRRLSGPELQALAAQRSQVIQALVGATRQLASEAGVAVSASTVYEVQSTLNAALADPAVAEQVRSGSLLRAASYAGFGPALDPDALRAASEKAAPKREAADRGHRSRSDARAKDAAKTQAGVEKAEAEVAASLAALEDAKRLSNQLTEDHQALSAQLSDLEHRQREAVRRVQAAERAYRRAVERCEEARDRANDRRSRRPPQ